MNMDELVEVTVQVPAGGEPLVRECAARLCEDWRPGTSFVAGAISICRPDDVIQTGLATTVPGRPTDINRILCTLGSIPRAALCTMIEVQVNTQGAAESYATVIAIGVVGEQMLRLGIAGDSCSMSVQKPGSGE